MDASDNSLEDFEKLCSLVKPLTPKYIFVHVQNSRKFVHHVKNWDTWLTIIHSNHQPDRVYIPFSGLHSQAYLTIKIGEELSPNILDNARQSYFNDMRHPKIIQDMGLDIWKDDQKPVECVLLTTRGKLGIPRFCLYSILSHKYNLTTVHTSRIARYEDVIGSIMFDVGLTYNLDELDKFAIYRVQFEKFFFQVTTQTRTIIGGSFASLFSPFDLTTWLLTLFVCVGISLFKSRGNKGHTRANQFVSILTQFINIVSLLLGQFGPGLVKIFDKRLPALSFLTFSFFGSYILMENLYKGYIFAALTVQSTPHVPDSFSALVDSSIPIVSYLKVVKNRDTPWTQLPCALSDKIILEILPNIDFKFAGILTKFNARLSCIAELDNVFFQAVSKSGALPVQMNRWLENVDTFAVADTLTILRIYSDMMKVLGGRYVVKRLVDTPFHETILTFGEPNFVQGKIYNVFGGLVESGIFKRFENLEVLGKQLEFMDAQGTGSATRRKLIAMAMSNAREEVDVFNEANPVSLNTVKHVFALFAIFCAIGEITFVVEGRALIFLGIRFLIRPAVKGKYIKKRYRSSKSEAFQNGKIVTSL
ncbi:hypothetical protein Fcan01_20034 [Folsomia candida]|uniref:Uncharacterized protein n=1 Tax=Folsomia candida TaxID=158441 RepID=A0A226DIH9_FOLCA|nr:hypothetical protein Fcan01_20034 [Folsomia candida]